MIDSPFPRSFGLWRLSIGILAVLSLSSFAVSAWLLVDFRHEQVIIAKIIEHLPASDLPQARELARELQLQSRLLVLLLANLIGTAIALSLLGRAYFSSERHLRRVRVQAEDILASMAQGIITTDLHGRVLNLNPKAEELLGRREIGTPFALAELPDAHCVLEEMRTAFLAGQQVPEQYYSVEQNHHVRHLLAGCSVLRDHNKNPSGVVIYLQDVTEKALMEQRILRMERYMGLGSLAAGLQHEIKNPLSALTLHVQLLKESLESICQDASVDESLEVISTEVRRITRVLENFREFASVKELEPVPTDVRQLVARILKLTSVEASEKNIKLTLDCDDTTDYTVEVDATRMEQVILNLIVNAFAAMPNGGEITIKLSKQDEQLTILFADTGCGIPAEMQDKVFDPYFTTKPTGTGMGLALSDKIIRQHNGSFDFVSSPEGTTFTILLPSNAPTPRKMDADE